MTLPRAATVRPSVRGRPRPPARSSASASTAPVSSRSPGSDGVERSRLAGPRLVIAACRICSLTSCQELTIAAPVRRSAAARRSAGRRCPPVRLTRPARRRPCTSVATELGASRSSRASWPGRAPGLSARQDSSSSCATDRPPGSLPSRPAARAARRIARRSRETTSAISSPSGSGPAWAGAAAAVGAIRPGGAGMQMSITSAKTQMSGASDPARPAIISDSAPGGRRAQYAAEQCLSRAIGPAG